MSTIRVIYGREPNFPATDQHPDAVRYKIGARWVDAIGGKPSAAEIDAVLNPPQPAPEDTDLTAEDTERLLRSLGVTPTQISAAKQARGEPWS